MEQQDVESCAEHVGQANQDEGAQLSKNQIKKMRKREKWLAIKQEKRQNDKLKKKRRLAEMRENGEDTGPTRKSLKRKVMKNSTCKIKVVIDLSLDEYMAEKDVTSLTRQLEHSYAANRRAENPMQLYFCGISGKTKERLDRIGDYKGWDIYTESQTYEKVFPVESLVYLSSESSNVLTTLSEDKVYVIGGLVDHNKYKGLCHCLAEEKGIAHAQLPISDYLDLKTRKVLTVNQVFSILLRYTETKDWETAFLTEMPQRKIVIPKEKLSSKGEDKHDDSAGSQESKQTVVAGPAEEQAGAGTVSASLLDKHSKPEANAGPKNIEKKL